MTLADAQPFIDRKLVTARWRGDLVILNYTDACTYQREWNEVTRQCRGLILNGVTGEIVARPFPKFFNLGETPETQLDALPSEGYEVFEKMDGSLGILYRDNGFRVATRGSFDSEQAIEATRMLDQYDLSALPDDVTLLVEIIYPENRIIVDYHGERALVGIGAFNRFTGEEYSWSMVRDLLAPTGISRCAYWPGLSLETCVQQKADMPFNREGFVIRFASGLRVKVKGDEYMKVARILAHATPLTLWRTMQDGKVPRDVIAQLPEEFRLEMEGIAADLESAYLDVLNDVRRRYVDIGERPDQKSFAMAVKAAHNELGTGLFALRSGKMDALDTFILKRIRPVGGTESEDRNVPRQDTT